jgi:hypothetical protein
MSVLAALFTRALSHQDYCLRSRSAFHAVPARPQQRGPCVPRRRPLLHGVPYMLVHAPTYCPGMCVCVCMCAGGLHMCGIALTTLFSSRTRSTSVLQGMDRQPPSCLLGRCYQHSSNSSSSSSSSSSSNSSSSSSSRPPDRSPLVLQVWQATQRLAHTGSQPPFPFPWQIRAERTRCTSRLWSAMTASRRRWCSSSPSSSLQSK